MIQIIDSNCCKDNFIQYSPYIGKMCNNHLTVDSKEIILLNSFRNLLVDKSFKNSLTNGYSSQLFEFDKIYLHFNYSRELGYDPQRLRFTQSYFTKYYNKTLRLEKELAVDSTSENKLTVGYDTFMDIFDYFSYVDKFDAVYILSGTGDILLASNTKDGCILDNSMSLVKRISTYLGHLKVPSVYIVTTKNDSYDVKYCQFKKDSMDNFEMITSDIPIFKPILSIDYCLNERIEFYSENYSKQKSKRK